jgi:hypothetical protein
MTDRAFWQYLHDGSIERIDGAVPGDLVVRVSIEYLRAQFAGAGDGFDIALHGCTRFEFEPYGGVPCDDLAAIAAMDVEILSRADEMPLTIACVTGVLRLDYAAAAIRLDTGEPVTIEQLVQASDAYWAAWEARGRAQR